MRDQIIVFITLAAVLVLFIQNRLRYDVVAVLALVFLVIVGIVPASEAFLGFGHPAVVTVAIVLVLSKGLQLSGLVDVVARLLTRVGGGLTGQMFAMLATVVVCSAFMNNVGALALLMPVAIHLCKKNGQSPSIMLMPLAFGSLLGGMTTLIGTPPNIIISSFRPEIGQPPYRMFDFAPVGVGVAVVGTLFLGFVGWRLIPKRMSAGGDGLFEVNDYMTELRVPPESGIVGKPIRDIPAVAAGEIMVISLIRDEVRLPIPGLNVRLAAGDVLVVQSGLGPMQALVDGGMFELRANEVVERSDIESEDILLREAVVSPSGSIVGRTIADFGLRDRFGVNMLAVSRAGARLTERLGRNRLRAGDVLLLQGPTRALETAIRELGCWPLARRGLQIGFPKRMLPMVAIFAGALIVSAIGLLPVQIALAAGALLAIILRLIPLPSAYESVDWPVIVLLGAMIPVGQALETTGGATAIADGILRLAEQLPPLATLAVILVGTMFLSDIVNNAAAAVLMAPIAISVADGLAVSADPFLMAVCIGASCAFLTPIGHQSNTLVMGPGGYKFGDYWKMGLVLEALVAITALWLLPRYWPF